jgi:glycosyltransferase involved in cell wall biosynthesis
VHYTGYAAHVLGSPTWLEATESVARNGAQVSIDNVNRYILLTNPPRHGASGFSISRAEGYHSGHSDSDGQLVRIGVMLRHVDQHGGGVLGYTRELMRRLPLADPDTEYVYLYPDEAHLGMLGVPDNVREVVVKAPGKLLWDQVAMPRMARRYEFDLLFNPKYSLPLGTRCKTTFVCHGLDWYVMPWGSKLADRLSHRYLVPRYAAKADVIIAVSDTTARHLVEYLGVSPEKVRRVYHGFDPIFLEPVQEASLCAVRSKYRLPRRFFLYVGQIYPPKNFGRLLRAFREVGPDSGVDLVVAGEHRWLSKEDLALIDTLGLNDRVHQTGWIEHNELPAFYRLCEALLLPSLYESFGLPILEAIASGCPVVTSSRYGTEEVAGGAAVLVDPEDVGSIADGMRRLLVDPEERRRCIDAGHHRVLDFSWEKCASETRNALHDAAGQA